MSKEKLQDDYKAPVSNEDMVELAKQQYEQKKRFLIINFQQKS
jgi:hypothetical protein